MSDFHLCASCNDKFCDCHSKYLQEQIDELKKKIEDMSTIMEQLLEKRSMDHITQITPNYPIKDRIHL
jgi:cytochrome c553